MHPAGDDCSCCYCGSRKECESGAARRADGRGSGDCQADEPDGASSCGGTARLFAEQPPGRQEDEERLRIRQHGPDTGGECASSCEHGGERNRHVEQRKDADLAAIPCGWGRCCSEAMTTGSAPASSERNAANHRTGASRNPQSMATKHDSHAAVIMSMRVGLGRTRGVSVKGAAHVRPITEQSQRGVLAGSSGRRRRHQSCGRPCRCAKAETLVGLCCDLCRHGPCRHVPVGCRLVLRGSSHRGSSHRGSFPASSGPSSLCTRPLQR